MKNVSSRGRSLLGLGTALLILSLAIPSLTAPALGMSAPNPSAPPEQWAYGGQHWSNASSVLPHAEYHVASYFGWTVVYTLTNTSNTSFQLEAQRTMGVSYSAQICTPSCTHANASLNLSLHGMEQETGFANLTTVATVDENGSSVPALGLTDAQSVGRASLNESVVGSRTVAGIHHVLSSSLSVSSTSSAQVTFSTSLGLIPWNVAPDLAWNSSASFTASGAYALQYAWSLVGMNGSISGSLNGSGHPSGAVNASGTVALVGKDLGNLTLANGLTTPVVVLLWTSGPFDGVDGVILVPHGFEIFSDRTHDWDGHAPGIQSVATSRLDLYLDVLHHRLRVAAAASSYSGSDSLSTSASGAGPFSPAAGSTGPSAALVQAQPESVPAAQATASCLLGGCGGAASSGNVGRVNAAIVALGLLALVALTVVGAATYWNRRRGPHLGGPAGIASGPNPTAPPFRPGTEGLRPLSGAPGAIEPNGGPMEPPRSP